MGRQGPEAQTEAMTGHQGKTHIYIDLEMESTWGGRPGASSAEPEAEGPEILASWCPVPKDIGPVDAPIF